MSVDDPNALNAAKLRGRAVAAARGDAPFDVLLTGGVIADVLTGQCRSADVGLVGPLIASCHPSGARSDAGSVIDATGATIAPGLIDTHLHIESSMITPAVYGAALVARGVTTLVWDPHELANVAGRTGMDWALAAARAAPLRILCQAPSSVPSAPGFELAGAAFGADAIAALLPDCPAGLAEVMDMRAVIDRAPAMRAILQTTLDAGRALNGHARGLSGPALQAFVAAGIASDHEITGPEDLLEKLAAGLWIEMRGSHPHLLPGFVAALNTLPQLPPTLTLCTDDVFADDLQTLGGLDGVFRQVVALGLPPLSALRAATWNAAQKIARPDLGLVAPGRRADLVLLDDLASFRVRQVLIDGGPPPVPEAVAPPPALSASVHLAPLAERDFTLTAKGRRVRLAAIQKPRFTEWAEREAEVVDGIIQRPPDATWIAVVHRHGRGAPHPRMGLLTGWGTWQGAFATTVSHDSHNLTVFGGAPADMAAAANALIASGGGMAVAVGGRVIAHLPLPIGGLLSEAPLNTIAEELGALRTAMDRVLTWEPPLLTFKALVGATLACNPGPHQTDLGIADPHAGRLLPSPVLGPA
ncbi:MAG: adenine deaminase C-terminal domain-containing protein [Pseudomonadota bacterium]